MLATVVLALSMGGCEREPTHPTLRDADLPKLIPVRDLFAHPLQRESYRVSPDGKKLIVVRSDRRTVNGELFTSDLILFPDGTIEANWRPEASNTPPLSSIGALKTPSVTIVFTCSISLEFPLG